MPKAETNAGHILVVDDHPEMLRGLDLLLRSEGFAVSTATSGPECLDLTRREHPDLILLDLRLPGLDGHRVCAQICQDKELGDTPIIVFSGAATADDKVKALSSGAVDFVTKPFETAELLARVKLHLRLLHYQRALEEYGERTEAERQESADLYRSVVEHSPLGAAIVVPGKPLLFVNSRMAEIVEIPVEEQQSENFDFTTIVSEPEREMLRDNFRRRLAGEELPPYTLTINTPSGVAKVIEVHNTLVSIHGQPAIQVQVMDVTERERAAAELRAADELRRQFIEAILSAQDEERRRLARELHDQTGSSLTTLLIGLESAAEAPDLDAMRQHLERLRKLGQTTIADVGLLARGLHPMALEELGFAAALRQHVEEYMQFHKIHVELVLPDPVGELPSAAALALYRIVQEALNNVAKHANASNVYIDMSRDNGLELTIEDDGVGLAPRGTDPARTTGMGLQGIRERASLLGGELELSTSSRGGARLKVRIPVERAQ